MAGTWTRQLPPYEIGAAAQTMPNAATDVTTTDTYILQLVFTNTTSGSVTIKVVDKQSPAKVLISDQASLAAGNTVVFNFPQGAFLKGGMNWVCSAGSSVDAEVYGYHV